MLEKLGPRGRKPQAATGTPQRKPTGILRYLRPSPAMVVAIGALVLAMAGGTWAVTKERRVVGTTTLTISTSEAGPHQLFRVGTSTVSAICEEADPNGPEAGGIKRGFSLQTGPDGAFVVTGDGGDGGAIPPNEGDVFGLFDEIPPGAVRGALISFAIFDGGGSSASGTAALMADPDNDRCTVTAQVAG